MKAIFSAAILGIAATFVFSFAVLPYGNQAYACGWGKTDAKSVASTLSKEQAVEIVSQHINQLNPDLRVGSVNDSGTLYEAEIVSANQSGTLQIIGVYKDSGQLVVLN